MKIKRIFFFLVMMALNAVMTGCAKDNGFLKIDSKRLEQVFDANGGNVQIPVNTTYTDFSVEVADGAGWIHAEAQGLSVNVGVDAMDGGPDRTGRLVISAPDCKPVEISVIQKAITVASVPEKIELSNSSLTFSFKITAGCRIGFELPSWIHPMDADWAAGTKTYSFEADRFLDSSAESRQGTVVLKSLDDRVDWKTEIPVVQSSYTNEAIQTIAELWRTSPLNLTQERYSLLAKIEEYSREFNRDPFQEYLKMNDSAAEKTEKDNPVMSIYRFAFDNVFHQVRNATVEYGTAEIWMLYNMGYIVKTPSVCFGIDINHRYAQELAPYLDFICVTHSDGDHVDTPLMNVMTSAGKPVLSNFFSASSAWCSNAASVYNIAGVEIKTCITDENATDLNCTTCYRFTFGEDAGNLRLMHPGDSSFDPKQFVPVGGGDVDVLILRFGQKAEVNICGTGSGQVVPHNILLSHQIELRHYIEKSPMRATILGSIENIGKNYGSWGNIAYLPFWGEHLVWKDGKLN